MQPIIVMTSCDKSEDAEKISKKILAAKLAACVQISSVVKSSYWWQGKIVTEEEYIVSMKSMRDKFALLSEKIARNHPYEIPEIIATDISAVSQSYLEWLSSELSTE